MCDVEDIVGELNEQITLKWTVPDFFLHAEETEEYIESPEFSFKNTKWRFVLYPNGERGKESVGWIGLYIQMGHSLTPEYSVKVKIGLEYGPQHASHKGNMTSIKSGGVWGTNSLIERSKLLDVVQTVEDSVVVFCNTYSDEIPNKKKGTAEVASQTRVLQGDIFEGLKEMFLSGQNTDVIIRVKNQELRAHNFILKSRCPSFAAKSENGVITCEEHDVKVFQNFILYLYTGQTEGVFSLDSVFNLYALAEKYDVKDLKAECVEFLMENVSTDAICDVLTLAGKYNDAMLMKTARKFFVENLKAIVYTDKWRTFIREYPSLVSELIMEMIS